MKIEDCAGYELIEKRKIEGINSMSYLLMHKKSGARVALLENEDENKVFSIGFRTPPKDDTGIPHILEHSVLCGSDKFPAKDPFVELVKGSLNTFLNAMTYPDKTVYPVASCNDTDFLNLMNVYMDAVFHPNIYKRKEIFLQEGWHYELEDENADLKLNGVVYNEMKGAFSSPEDVLERAIMNALLPDTAYGLESGGDPERIPDLSYEDFLAFHKKYYHPSNSYIYLYGNMDMASSLNWLDQEYLQYYEKIEVDSELKWQKPFEKMRKSNLYYPISDAESVEDNSYLSYNAVVGDALDKELYLAFDILDYAMLKAPGAPLKQALLDAGIGKDIISSYDSGIRQPIFSIIAKNANADRQEEFVTLIQKTLKELVNQGLDKNALEAGINSFEFRFREADYGGYPKGLIYGLQAYDSWLYDDSKPFMHLDAIDTYALLKEKVAGNFYEELVEKYLIHNTHAALVVVEPQNGLGARKEKELALKLENMKKNLTKSEIEGLVSQTKNLEKYQEEPSPQSDLEKIPMLKLEDIGRKARPFQNEESMINDTKLLFHEMDCNGIRYLNLVFSMKGIKEELLCYAALLKSVLGYVNTKNYDYTTLYHEMNRKSGGISANIGLYANLKEEKDYEPTIEIRAKALSTQMNFVFELMGEILTSSDIKDMKRLYEIIAEQKSRLQMTLPARGHGTAVSRALSYESPVYVFSECTSGITYYQFLEDMEAHFEERKEMLYSGLSQVISYVFNQDKLLISLTGDSDAKEGLKEQLEGLIKTLNENRIIPDENVSLPKLPAKEYNEGFLCASQVQYVAVAGNFLKKGLPYVGTLKILKTILNYEYLWIRIRVKGGAYGCMSGFTRTGEGYMASFRDPNLEKTLDTFSKAVEYLKDFHVSDRDMLKYIIGTVSEMDTPLPPSIAGLRSLSAYLSGVTEDMIQAERDEVLRADEKSVRALAPYMEAILSDHLLCVLGNENELNEHKELFGALKPLFH